MPMRKIEGFFILNILSMKDAKRLSKPSTATIITQSGRGAVRLACLHGVQEVEGSNPFAPTKTT